MVHTNTSGSEAVMNDKIPPQLATMPSHQLVPVDHEAPNNTSDTSTCVDAAKPETMSSSKGFWHV